MNMLRSLNLKGNPVTTISKYRDQIVLLSNSIQELDGKDIIESERKYLINLLSRKKVQGTVYNDMKKKKENLSIQGNNYTIHEQKNFILGNNRNKLGFMEFKQMYGDGGFTDE